MNAASLSIDSIQWQEKQDMCVYDNQSLRDRFIQCIKFTLGFKASSVNSREQKETSKELEKLVHLKSVKKKLFSHFVVFYSSLE